MCFILFDVMVNEFLCLISLSDLWLLLYRNATDFCVLILFCTLCVCVLITQSYATFVTPWTVAHQDPLSMGFSRQQYWSGLAFPSLGDLPNPGIKPRSALQADSLPSEPPGFVHPSTPLKTACVVSNNCPAKCNGHFCFLTHPSAALI